MVYRHPALGPGEVKLRPTPDSEVVRVYGCKNCGIGLDEAMSEDVPCAGEPIEDLLARWGEDLTVKGFDGE